MPNSIQAPGLQVRFHFLFALVGAAAFTFESWAFGPYSWMYGYGAGLEAIPAHLALSYNDRNFAFWSPFIAGGLDRLSFWGNADPTNIEPLLIALLPTWLANGAHRFLQYFVAIFFTARVCAEQLKLDHRWSAVAGYLHGCFAYFTFGEMLAFPGVPLLLWVLDRLRNRGTGTFVALLAGAAFSCLTTFTHSDPYLLVFSVGWVVFVWRECSIHLVRQVALFFVGLLVMDSPQLFAAASNAALSYRANWPLEPVDWSIDGLFYRQLQFDFFNQDPIIKKITMGLPRIALVLGAVLAFLARHQPKVREHTKTFAGVALLYTLLSQKWLIVYLQFFVSSLIPWVKGVNMGRFYTLPAAFLIAAFLALSLAILWRLLSPSVAARRAALTAMIAFAVFMTVWPKIVLLRPLGIEGWGEKNFQVAALEALKQRQAEPFRVASVLPLQPSYAYAQGLETADGWANLFPQVYRQLWLRVNSPLFTNLPKNKDIFDPDQGKPQDVYIFLGADLSLPGIGRLPGENPQEAVRHGFDINRRFNLRLLGLLNVRYLLSDYPLKSPGLRIVHAPEHAPRWPLSRDWATGIINSARPPLEGGESMSRLGQLLSEYGESLRTKQQGKDIYIYELADWLPRFRFVERVLIEATGRAVLDRLAASERTALAMTGVIEEIDAGALGGRQSFDVGTVKLTSYTPDMIELELDNPRVGLLVIANTWNPYWRAEVDGQPRELFRVNHAQFGLLTHGGERRVTLRYSPPYSSVGIFKKMLGL